MLMSLLGATVVTLLTAPTVAPEWLGPGEASCIQAPGQAAPCPAAQRVYHRIVALAPSFTETLFAIGAGERVVAVTRFDHEPPAVERLPKVGGFVDPDVEAVLALRPDLVVAAPVAGSRGRLETMARLGATVLVMPAESLAELWQAITLLGRATETEQQAAALTERLARELASIEQASAKLAPLSVLLVVGYRPLIVAGPHSFLDSLCALVNARNAVQRGNAFVQLDLEAVRAASPAVIVDITLDEAAPRGLWQLIAEHTTPPPRVVPARDETLLRPGPRLATGLRALARALRPENRP